MPHNAPSPVPEAAPTDDAFVQAVAKDADVDPRSVIRRLAGLPVAGRAGRRIDAAIARRRLAGSSGT